MFRRFDKFDGFVFGVCGCLWQGGRGRWGYIRGIWKGACIQNLNWVTYFGAGPYIQGRINGILRYFWWWLAHPHLLCDVTHGVYFLIREAYFHIRLIVTFHKQNGGFFATCAFHTYVRGLTTWHLFHCLIGYAAFYMWPHL